MSRVSQRAAVEEKTYTEIGRVGVNAEHRVRREEVEESKVES